MYLTKIFSLVLLLLSGTLLAQAQTDLPLAETIPFTDSEVAAGTVIAHDEPSDTFSEARLEQSSKAYGVVAPRPPIVLVTASNTVPVVTRGATYVMVKTNPALKRGDVLSLSDLSGVATKAASSSETAFAIALASTVATTSPTQLLLATINHEQAKQALVQKQQSLDNESASDEDLDLSNIWRSLIAAVLALAAIAFLLISIRSILKNGITSVGRNPRSQRSVLILAIASVLAVLIITAVVLLTAIAVLVLPV